jgi:hypothetical protein
MGFYLARNMLCVMVEIPGEQGTLSGQSKVCMKLCTKLLGSSNSVSSCDNG